MSKKWSEHRYVGFAHREWIEFVVQLFIRVVLPHSYIHEYQCIIYSCRVRLTLFPCVDQALKIRVCNSSSHHRHHASVCWYNSILSEGLNSRTTIIYHPKTPTVNLCLENKSYTLQLYVHLSTKRNETADVLSRLFSVDGRTQGRRFRQRSS